MANSKNKSTREFCGIKFKQAKNSWTKVQGSEKKLPASLLKEVDFAVVRESSYGGFYLSVNLIDGSYASFPKLDVRCPASAGQLVKPSSIRVYELSNGEDTITKCWVEGL